MAEPTFNFKPVKPYSWVDYFNTTSAANTNTANAVQPTSPITTTISSSKVTSMPSVFNGDTLPKVKPPKTPESMWSGKNIGGTMQGIGAVAGAVGSMLAVHETKKYNKKILDMEEKRLAKANKKADDKNAEYSEVWG